MKRRPDHEKSLLGRVPPGTLASSSERFTKSLARQPHTWPNQQAARSPSHRLVSSTENISNIEFVQYIFQQVRHKTLDGSLFLCTLDTLILKHTTNNLRLSLLCYSPTHLNRSS
ncbi:MAG: hypothetical protein KTR25_01325 [Myxococcales bacterium]|nr:hypothetical protein [Myxococcales bacterium]